MGVVIEGGHAVGVVVLVGVVAGVVGLGEHVKMRGRRIP